MKLRNWRGVFFSISVLSWIGLFAGCQTNEPVFPEPKIGQPEKTAPVESADYGDKLRVGDTIRVIFSNVTDKPILPHEEQVKDDGTITLFLVGTVKAAGKTTGELQNELQKSYGKYYVSMTVTVQAPERYYSVGGEVKTPKRDVYAGGTTVIKAIQSAGDFTDFANRKNVQLTRANGKIYKINCEKALDNPSLDLPVYPGDYIYVPRRFF